MILTAEEARRLFHYDPLTGIVTRKVAVANCHVGDVAGSANGQGYMQVDHQGRPYQLHRVIWLMVTGEWPKDKIDHKNLTVGDNRWTNLREANNGQNKCNGRVYKNNESGIKGVTQDKRTGRWQARITINKKTINLGFYAEMAEATAARANAQVLHGEFGRM